MASVQQLTSLTADDIFVKLKYLTVAVILLFIAMHVGGLLGLLRSNARKKSVLQKIMCAAEHRAPCLLFSSDDARAQCGASFVRAFRFLCGLLQGG